jgi:hypothetical protein
METLGVELAILEDPIFLAIFVTLAISRLFSTTPTTIPSIVLTALVSAAGARLIPLVVARHALAISRDAGTTPDTANAPHVPDPDPVPPSPNPPPVPVVATQLMLDEAVARIHEFFTPRGE